MRITDDKEARIMMEGWFPFAAVGSDYSPRYTVTFTDHGRYVQTSMNDLRQLRFMLNSLHEAGKL